MTGEKTTVDFYFDDVAPDGFHEYHLRASKEGTLELFRDDKPIRDAVGRDFVENNMPLFQDGVLRTLLVFARNPGRTLVRTDAFDGDVGPYLTRLRQLFNDTDKPYRIIRTAGTGGVVFVPEVRNAPSKYGSSFRRDFRQHWKPSAAGAATRFRDETRWCFTGRHAALQRVVSWLGEPSSGGSVLVVTGDPGSGKSALLGFLVAASYSHQPDESLDALLKLMPASARPARDIINFAMDLHRKTVVDVLASLADCFHSQPGAVLDLLFKRDEKTVLLFDALDEAVKPPDIAEALCSLIRRPNIWLLIGGQRSELGFTRSYPQRVETIDLNLPEFAGDTHIAPYVEKLLLTPDDAPAGNPYADYPIRAAEAAEAVSVAAHGNFLVAHVLAQYLINRKTVLELDREPLPRVAEGAFKKYLHAISEKLGWTERERLPLALRPLAYAEGAGVPFAVWKTLLRGAGSDVDAILRQECALIGEYRDGEQRVFRLYHDSLARALRDARLETEHQAEIVQALTNALPNSDWRNADWYTQRQLATHAAKANLLDKLLLDTGFLAVADTSRLLAVAGFSNSIESRRRLDWYRLTVDRFDVAEDLNDRLMSLEVVACQTGAKDLSEEIRRIPWYDAPRLWAVWQPQSPHRVLRAHSQPITAVATHGSLVASGSRNGTVRLWDRATGAPIGEPTGISSAEVSVIAVDDSLVFAGYKDGSLLFWNLPTGELLGSNAQGHSTWAGDGGSESVSDSAGANARASVADSDGSGEQQRSVSDHEFGEVVAVDIADDFLLACFSPPRIDVWTRSFEPVKDQSEVMRCVHRSSSTFLHFKPEVNWFDSTLEDIMRNWTVRAMRLDRRLVIDGDGAGNVRASSSFSEEGFPMPLGFIPALHGDQVTAIALDGEVAASGSDDESIMLWDHERFEVIDQPRYGHEGSILALDLTKDWIVSGGQDKTIRVWRRGVVQPVGQAALAAGNPIRAFSVGADVVCTGHRDDTVRLWDRDTGKPVGLPLCAEWVWRWEGEPEYDAPITSILRNSLYGLPPARTWMRISAELRERTAKEKRPKSWINSVAANRDFVAAGHQSGAIWLWDRHLGRQITEIDTDLFCSFNDVGDYVSALALSDDNLLAVGTIHGRVYLWDLNSLRRADTMNYDLITPTDGFHSQRITLFTILPAHIVSVSADNRVLLWDRLKGRPLGTVYGSEISTDGMPVMIDPIVHKNEETNQWSVIYPPFPLDFAEPLARGLGSTPIEVILKHDGLYARCVQGIARIAWA